MTIKLILILLGFVIMQCYGQRYDTKYYDIGLHWEVPKKEADAYVTTTHFGDTTIIEARTMNKDELIFIENYKLNEPIGVWTSNQHNTWTSYQGFLNPVSVTVNYDFQLKYSTETCIDSIFGMNFNYFENNAKFNYIAPKVEGYSSVLQFVLANIQIPRLVKEESSVKVVVGIIVKETGEIEDVFVVKGTNIFIDKEVVRIIRQLKFSSPPTINGQSNKLCINLNLKIKID